MMILLWCFLLWNEACCFYFDVSQICLHPLNGLLSGGMAVGDFDVDGLSDFVVGGVSASNGTNFFLYKQNSSLQFFDITNTVTFPGGLPAGFYDGRPIFVDVNLDGRTDVFYTGSSSGPGITDVYLQSATAASVFYPGTSVCFPAGIPQVGNSFADFGDFDGDGLWDILLVGMGSPFVLMHQNASKVYTNIAGMRLFQLRSRSP